MKELILFVLCVLPITANKAPVLLWGTSIEEKPALWTINSQVFGNIINKLLNRYMLVTFIEEQLNLRTVTLIRENNGSTFEYMRNCANKTFYMNVEYPLKSLINNDRKIITYNRILKQPLKCIVGSKHVIRFVKGNTIDHDKKIKNIAKTLYNCPVVYAYTSKKTTKSNNKKLRRLKRSTVKVASNNMQYVVAEQLAMAWEKFILYENQKSTNITFQSITSDVQKFYANINMTIGDDGRNMALLFELVQGYYVLNYIDLNSKKFVVNQFEVPYGMSYACNKLYAFQESTSNHLVWHKFQIQFHKNTDGDNIHFLEAWSCDGFLTSGILSGLFCVAILLAIAFCGIICIMNINNMDRFDDPYGKSLMVTNVD